MGSMVTAWTIKTRISFLVLDQGIMWLLNKYYISDNDCCLRIFK